MNSAQFYQLAEQLMHNVEEQIDHHIEQTDADIDYEIHGNVMTITLENQSKIIINTQEPLHQIWLASRKQGYHFDYQNGDWICDRTGASFMQVLQQAIAEQS